MDAGVLDDSGQNGSKVPSRAITYHKGCLSALWPRSRDVGEGTESRSKKGGRMLVSDPLPRCQRSSCIRGPRPASCSMDSLDLRLSISRPDLSVLLSSPSLSPNSQLGLVLIRIPTPQTWYTRTRYTRRTHLVDTRHTYLSRPP
jgi:hypothetical protein